MNERVVRWIDRPESVADTAVVLRARHATWPRGRDPVLVTSQRHRCVDPVGETAFLRPLLAHVGCLTPFRYTVANIMSKHKRRATATPADAEPPSASPPRRASPAMTILELPRVGGTVGYEEGSDFEPLETRITMPSFWSRSRNYPRSARSARGFAAFLFIAPGVSWESPNPDGEPPSRSSFSSRSS